MSSGVTVADEVVNCFNEMKVRKSCSQEEMKLRKKVIFMKLDSNKEKIILDTDKMILVGQVQDKSVADPLRAFVDMLPLTDCCYVLYDAFYETKESKKEELVFIHWSPDKAPIMQKMIYASSKGALKKKLNGIKHEWQVNAIEELLDQSELMSKLGTQVIAFESQKLV
ncbi:cofilin-2-like [Scyliorhinus canicula]|uniref:cofilin-2-like n=1 Tax=Scyliorhinus canicula TaxID=7830 RepID=UPI0018F29A75|nr:cofilin-2-like [Scyliorhinus canicula]